MISGGNAAAAAVCLLFALAVECVTGGGTPWATPDQEALDEVRDAEIFRSIVTSVQEWQKRHNSHRRKRAESSVCYPEVGCFQDSGPFSYLDMLPSPPEEVSTRFFLFSSKSRGGSPQMDIPFTNLSNVWPIARQTFNVSAPTKVIVHGFGGSCSHVWVYEMRSALMTVESCNVICVDWEAGAVIPNYVRAAANTRLVGKQLSMLLSGLNKHVGLPFHNVHVIGFSLGAHVAGFAGAELKNLSRITGLDPAAPLFESQDPQARLDSTDAMFVDVVHSNGENLILGGLGSWQPMGHVDFYPNGGRMQKGCTNLFVGAVSDILWSASDVEGRSLCNHRRAYKFFTDSVSPRCHFPAFPCESYDKFLQGDCFPCNGDRRCGNMGYYADKSNGRGTLFLITREEEPFCAHQYHVRVENAPSPVPVTSYGKMELTLISNADINETFPLTQKDDEELKMGTSLARIAVPHPVLQEPKRVQIMYTAYSGWISSGLPSWSVQKVTLTDSFGKSMSVCKKDLILESSVPVTLPLYPGECNPPRENDSTTFTSVSPTITDPVPELPSLNSTDNTTKFIPTPVFHIGDEILNNTSNEQDRISLSSWQPIEFHTNSLDGSPTKRENARAFNTRDEPANVTSQSDEMESDNYTSSERPEIKEPVLNPSSSKMQTRSGKEVNLHLELKPEITEPVLNPKSMSLPRMSEAVHNETDDKWTPPLELNPPAVGEKNMWHQWTTKATASNAGSDSSEKPVFEEKSFDVSTKTSEEGRQLTMPSSLKSMKKSPSSPLMVQFFPQRLAAILAQAENYARLTLSFPMTVISKLGYYRGTSGSDQETSASTNVLHTVNVTEDSQTQRTSKQLPPVRITDSEHSSNTSHKPSKKSVESSQSSKEVSSFIRNLPPIKDKNDILVPYFYSNNRQEVAERSAKFIPLIHYSEPYSRTSNNGVPKDSSKLHGSFKKALIQSSEGHKSLPER